MASLLLISATILVSFLFFTIFFSINNNNKKKKNNNNNNNNVDGETHRQLPLPPCPRGWPIVGNLPQLGSKPHQTLHNLSKVYGPLFRLRFGSATVVVASSADIASQFLRTQDAKFANRPPHCGFEYLGYNYQTLTATPYGPRWRMLRRLCSVHFISSKAMDDLQHVREEELAILCSRLQRADQAVGVKVGLEVNVCVANALARAMLGRRLFEEGGGGEFREMVVRFMHLFGQFNISDFVPCLKPLDLQGVAGKMKRLHKWFDKFLNKIIEEHSMEARGDHDFLSTLLELKENPNDEDQETKLTNTNIKAMLFELFTAGTDTTSITVEWALAELLRHPDILAAAQKELDSVVGRSRLVSEQDLDNLPLMQAIIKETFRLHPPTPLSLPHMSSEPCEIGGFHIPQGSTLRVNIWSIARDKAIWSNPLKFDPSRFLPGGKNADMDVKGGHFELIPFGAGRRICVGLRLGLQMVTMLVASFVHGFDWALPDGLSPETLNMDEKFGITLERTEALVARPIPRLGHEAYGV